jgi:hypothetical protein
MRYNTIANCTADGIFFEYGGAVNFQFYGNLYYNTPNSHITFKGGSGAYGPVYIYNNTFHAPSASSFGWIDPNGSKMVCGSQVYNNIFYNVANSLSGVTGVSSAGNLDLR